MKAVLLLLLMLAARSGDAAAAEAITPQEVLRLALVAARTVADPAERVSTLSNIAKAQDELGDRTGALATWHEAASSASAIAGVEARSIAEGLAKAGDTDGALAAVRLMEDPYSRALSLTNIAAAQAAAGSRSEALVMLREATNDGRQIDPGALRDGAFSAIAATQAEHAGDVDGALATVKFIEEAGRAAQTLVGVAAFQRNAGENMLAAAILRAALERIEAIQDSDERGELLAGFVETLANAGFADEAVAAAKAIMNAGYHGSGLAAASLTLAKAGAIDAALALVKTVEVAARGRNDSRDLIEALSSVGRVQLESRDRAAAAATFQEARTAADQIADSAERDRALAEIAVHQARAEKYETGHFSRVLGLAIDGLCDEKRAQPNDLDQRTLPTSADVAAAVATAHAIVDGRLPTLAVIAVPLLRAGDRGALKEPVREALATVAASPEVENGFFGPASFYIALVQVAAHDIPGALVTARSLQEPELRSFALTIAAWGQACGGDPVAAETTLDEVLATLPEMKNQDDLLAIIAVVQARLPDLDRALVTADRISDPAARASALAGIAMGRLAFR